jgi:hypothetical protein
MLGNAVDAVATDDGQVEVTVEVGPVEKSAVVDSDEAREIAARLLGAADAAEGNI